MQDKEKSRKIIKVWRKTIGNRNIRIGKVHCALAWANVLVSYVWYG